MKKILLALVSLICFLPLFAQEDVLTFKGIKLGINKNTFRSEMIRENFEFHSEDTQGRIMYFTGQFVGEECIITVLYNANYRVHRVIAWLPETSSWRTISYKYSNIKESLAKKYGRALIDMEDYKGPYTKGDGNKKLAVLFEEATIIAVYNSKAHPVAVSIVKADIGTMCITIAYSYASLSAAYKDYIYDDL